MSEVLPPPCRDRFPELEKSFLSFVNPTDTIGRVYSAAGPHPVRWNTFRTYGPSDSRFDHHPAPAGNHPRRGIAYGVSRPEDPNEEMLLVCLLERFQRTRVVDRWFDRPHFATYRPRRQLCLLNVGSRWATRAGCNGAISSGPHEMARRWSRAIYLHYRGDRAKYVDDDGRTRPVRLDGLLYRCSLWQERNAIALYERAADALPAAPLLDAPLGDSQFDEFMDDVDQVGLRLVVPGIGALPVPPSRA
ncbi:hypothetical protein [Lentzea sp.]|uniref:hypothetical protein n=1 Tax=Lentzea sp. TaxID=56099 RepID=UPI002ED13337